MNEETKIRLSIQETIRSIREQDEIRIRNRPLTLEEEILKGDKL